MPTRYLRSKPLMSHREYRRRLINNGVMSVAFLSLSIGMGMIGYHGWGGLSWLDAFYNAAMILTGMGPVDAMLTPGAKLFAGFYALYSGVAFLTFIAVLFAPVYQRFIHKLHLDTTEADDYADEASTNTDAPKQAHPHETKPR
jgi:hypothetical protein